MSQPCNAYNAIYKKEEDDTLLQVVAEAIDSGKVIGWYQGRQEWGPRALGNRSILGDPRHPKMREIINMKIKMREGFRPFAPSVVAERSQDYFNLEGESPYMLLVAPVKQEIQESDTPLHAITHVDGSARIQTVTREQNQNTMI